MLRVHVGASVLIALICTLFLEPGQAAYLSRHPDSKQVLEEPYPMIKEGAIFSGLEWIIQAIARLNGDKAPHEDGDQHSASADPDTLEQSRPDLVQEDETQPENQFLNETLEEAWLENGPPYSEISFSDPEMNENHEVGARVIRAAPTAKPAGRAAPKAKPAGRAAPKAKPAGRGAHKAKPAARTAKKKIPSARKSKKAKPAGRKSDKLEHEDIEGRIIDGKTAEVGQFPYQVEIKDTKAQFCGGTIFDAKTVVTAAHCFFEDGKRMSDDLLKKTLTFTAGSYSLEKKEASKQASKLKKLYIHEKYLNSEAAYDIAVVILATPFKFNDMVNKISTGNPPLEASVGDKAIVSGWGYTKAKKDSDVEQVAGGFPDQLQWTTVTIRNRQDCIDSYNDEPLFKKVAVRTDVLCAGGEDLAAGGKFGADSCQGDSGGPLVCIDSKRSNLKFFCGVVSTGFGCGALKRPGFYTKVFSFHKWILEKSKAK